MKIKREKNVKYYLECLQKQKDFYLPGSFWKDAIEKIGNNYIENGIDNLRNFYPNVVFFVPNYGTPANGFSEEKIAEVDSLISKNLNFKQSNLIKNSLSGYSQALADYRVFHASNTEKDIFDLTTFSESGIGDPK